METNKEKWYFKTSTLVIALFSVGPLALPLLWFHPRFSMMSKIVITAITLILTYYLFTWTFDSINNITGYYKQLGVM